MDTATIQPIKKKVKISLIKVLQYLSHLNVVGAARMMVGAVSDGVEMGREREAAGRVLVVLALLVIYIF